MATAFPTYCPTCGTSLDRREIEGRIRAYCPTCEQPNYRNPKPCAGVLVIEDDQVLLVKRSIPPASGSWSVPAGYLEHDEPPEVAATRELAEETGLTVPADAIELFDTAFIEHPDGTYVLVLLYTVSRDRTTGEPTPGSDAAAARFWQLELLAERGETLEPGYRELFSRAIHSLDQSS